METKFFVYMIKNITLRNKMKKAWLQKIEGNPNFPRVLRLEKGFPCYNALHKMCGNHGKI